MYNCLTETAKVCFKELTVSSFQVQTERQVELTFSVTGVCNTTMVQEG
jgi:hypothetical protein